jgi:hypothetical protein
MKYKRRQKRKFRLRLEVGNTSTGNSFVIAFIIMIVTLGIIFAGGIAPEAIPIIKKNATSVNVNMPKTPPKQLNSLQMYTFNGTPNAPKPPAATPTTVPCVPGGNLAGGPPGTPGHNWPFRTKSPSQYRRIDEGWDLQNNQVAEVLAMAPGTISQARPNPGGFGPNYPLETLDTPVLGYKMFYYGHVHIVPGIVGKHVNTGDVIAHTEPSGNISAGLPNWLEVGFWDPSVGPASKLHGRGGESATPEGQQMKDWLLSQNP